MKELELSCRDMGIDCDFTARSKSEDEVLRKMQDHGCKVHQKCDLSFQEREDLKEHLREVI